ncbi:MAG: SpoIIE family protein phosphatase [Acidisphaera sp.]|nr:SpoIIE family protein phosphatase [Acidisphaera sp.]
MRDAIAVDEDATFIARPGAGTPGRAPGGAAGEEIAHTLLLSEAGAVQQRIPVGTEPTTIGRVPPCEVVLDGSMVSRRHCRIQLMGEHVVATDLKSTNGTFVDGVRIAGAVPLQHGSVLQVGSHTLIYERRTRREIEEAAAIERDLQGASAYVQMLLPKPIDAGPVRANWLFLPCAHLGGNAFGYRFLDADIFAGYMLDVAGQGTGAAMHSVAVMNLLRRPSIPGIDLADPGSVLAGLDAMFRPEDHNGLFFSIWYFTFDRTSGELRYAAAGRRPGFLVPPERRAALPLAAGGPAIGLEPGRDFSVHTVIAPPGSMLYLLSDGASETADRSLRGAQGFLPQLVRSELRPGLPEPLRLYHALREAAGPDGFDEDFSVIAFTF